MLSETLKDGTQRLSAETCVFLVQRLEPGTLLTTMKGRDTDRFGDEPLDRVTAEHALFGKPVRWFIDAQRIQNAAGSVLERWSRWLIDNRSKLASIDVLVDSEPAYLTIAIGRHLSSTDDLMRVHRDPSTFSPQRVADGRFTEPAIPLSREQSSSLIKLITPSASFSFSSDGPILRSSICGDDYGQFGDEPFNEIERFLTRPLRWYVDATSTGFIAPNVRAAWSAWLSAHRENFEHIGFLTPPGTVALIVDIAREFSRTGDLIQRYTDPAAFERAARAR